MFDGNPVDAALWTAVIPAVHQPSGSTPPVVHGVVTLRGATKELPSTAFRLADKVMGYLGKLMFEIQAEVEGVTVGLQRDIFACSISKILKLSHGDPRELLQTSIDDLLQLIVPADRVQLYLWDARKHKTWLLDSTIQKEEDVIGQWISPLGLIKQVLWQGTSVSLGQRTIDNCFDKEMRSTTRSVVSPEQ